MRPTDDEIAAVLDATRICFMQRDRREDEERVYNAVRVLLSHLEAVAPPASGSSVSGRALAEAEKLLADFTEYARFEPLKFTNEITKSLCKFFLAGRRSMQEEAAKVAEAISREPAEIQAKDDETGSWDPWLAGFSSALDRIAAAIRALNPETKP
jgi:hypothetical protein